MGAAVAAAAARARREALEHFRLAGATRPETAVPLPDASLLGRRQLVRWQRRSVVRAAAGGGYWLDETAYAADEAARRRRAVIAVAIVIALTSAIAFLVQQTARPI